MEVQENKNETGQERLIKFTNEWENAYNALDIIKDIFVIVVVTGFAFGWVFLMLMLISFFTLGYLHFDFKVIVIISVVTGAAAGIAYTVKTVMKYRNMSFKRKH